MKYSGPKDRVDAARSENTSADELAFLSKADEIFVRAAVARNVNTPINVLNALAARDLSSEKDWEIAANLAENPNLRTETLLKLMESILRSSKDIEPRDYYQNLTVLAVSRSGAATPDILTMLSNPEYIPKHLRYNLLQSESRLELIELLLKDPSEKIRKRANSFLPKI